ncbi:hypothetical protein ACSSS7_003106 [Eimeria intestinalis]
MKEVNELIAAARRVDVASQLLHANAILLKQWKDKARPFFVPANLREEELQQQLVTCRESLLQLQQQSAAVAAAAALVSASLRGVASKKDMRSLIYQEATAEAWRDLLQLALLRKEIDALEQSFKKATHQQPTTAQAKADDALPATMPENETDDAQAQGKALQHPPSHGVQEESAAHADSSESSSSNRSNHSRKSSSSGSSRSSAKSNSSKSRSGGSSEGQHSDRSSKRNTSSSSSSSSRSVSSFDSGGDSDRPSDAEAAAKTPKAVEAAKAATAATIALAAAKAAAQEQ